MVLGTRVRCTYIPPPWHCTYTGPSCFFQERRRCVALSLPREAAVGLCSLDVTAVSVFDLHGDGDLAVCNACSEAGAVGAGGSRAPPFATEPLFALSFAGSAPVFSPRRGLRRGLRLSCLRRGLIETLTPLVGRSRAECTAGEGEAVLALPFDDSRADRALD